MTEVEQGDITEHGDWEPMVLTECKIGDVTTAAASDVAPLLPVSEAPPPSLQGLSSSRSSSSSSSSSSDGKARQISPLTASSSTSPLSSSSDLLQHQSDNDPLLPTTASSAASLAEAPGGLTGYGSCAADERSERSLDIVVSASSLEEQDGIKLENKKEPSMSGSFYVASTPVLKNLAKGYNYLTNGGGNGSNHNEQQKSLGLWSRRSYQNEDSFTASIRSYHQKIVRSIRQHTGSIGMLGSMAIACNSLTGPAMLNLPATFAKSGIIPTLVTILFVCALSCLCCLHLSNTISKIPGNSNFKQEIEFSDAFHHFWGHNWFLVTQVLFFCCILCLNISSIVDTAHVVDTFLGHWSPTGSVALKVSLDLFQPPLLPELVYWDYSVCSATDFETGDCLPFGDTALADTDFLMTAGNFVTTAVFLPLALMDLKENAGWQILGFIVLLITSLMFVIQFCLSGLHVDHVSWWGYDWDDLLGVVLFNFALVIAIPAWLYEREPHVSVQTVVCSSSALSAVLYIAIGLLGHMAMPNVSDNMLESMMSGLMGPALQLGASVFAFCIIGLGTPLFSVLTRLNLLGSGLCNRKTANAFSVYLPFTASWILYDSSKITKLLSWGGIVFTGLVAFILPLVLTYHVIQEFAHYEGSVPVYGNLKLSNRAELVSVVVLLSLTVIAIVVGVAGNFLG